jgi:hypothetical protein
MIICNPTRQEEARSIALNNKRLQENCQLLALGLMYRLAAVKSLDHFGTVFVSGIHKDET